MYTNYQGEGGVNIGPFWRRLVYAKYLRDWRMILTDNFTADTKLLMRRTIGDRVRTIAPFLRYDRDPYMVVADITDSQNKVSPDRQNEQVPPSNLFWESVISATTM